MDVRAIILVGGLPEAADCESFAGTPLALLDVLGKSALARVVDRLQRQNINGIAVIGETAIPATHKHVPCVEAGKEQFWRAAENAFTDMAQAGAEAVLVIRMGGYAEFEVDEFLQRHLDGRAHVTRAVDVNGSSLDMFMITGSRRNDAAFLFRHRLQQTRAAAGNWVFPGYSNPLACVRDLRLLSADGLMQCAQLTPVGAQRRPGVWIARGARLDPRVRLIAPAYIGEHARIRAGAVITRCSAVEHHAEIATGSVIENSSVLPYTYVGPGLDITHAVAGAKKLAHLPRNVEVEIADTRLLDVRPQHAALRAVLSVASLASFVPAQFFRGLLAISQRQQPAELPAAVNTPSAAIQTPGGFEASAQASSFPANLAVARRYGDQ